MEEIQITQALVDNLLLLCSGCTVPASSLNGEWVEPLKKAGILIPVTEKKKERYKAKSKESLQKAMAKLNEAFADWTVAIKTAAGNTPITRAKLAKATGDSKLVSVKTNRGFLINSYEPIEATLKGKSVIIAPEEGSSLFISASEQFKIAEDVTVVGVENMENFHDIRKQRKFFRKHVKGRLLFVSHFQTGQSLREWLMDISNQYVHYGDFDLAAIGIYQKNFEKYLPEKCSFLIPNDIVMRLKNGSRERYDHQYMECKDITSENPELQKLIDTIHKYRRTYDQEGYIDTR